MPDNKDKSKDGLAGPEEDQMGDYYTGGRAIQEKEFGAGQSAVEGQQKIDPGYSDQQSSDEQDKPPNEGGQGGSQSGFGGYGAGPGSLERQANRTGPGGHGNAPGKRDTNEPED
jgi:hypothetical protein